MQQLLEHLVRVDGDPQHLAADPAFEALHHAVHLRTAVLGVAMLSAGGGAGPGEAKRETAAVVNQHMVSEFVWPFLRWRSGVGRYAIAEV